MDATVATNRRETAVGGIAPPARGCPATLPVVDREVASIPVGLGIGSSLDIGSAGHDGQLDLRSGGQFGCPIPLPIGTARHRRSFPCFFCERMQKNSSPFRHPYFGDYRKSPPSSTGGARSRSCARPPEERSDGNGPARSTPRPNLAGSTRERPGAATPLDEMCVPAAVNSTMTSIAVETTQENGVPRSSPARGVPARRPRASGRT